MFYGRKELLERFSLTSTANFIFGGHLLQERTIQSAATNAVAFMVTHEITMRPASALGLQ